MTSHDHARPDLAAQKAVLAACRATLQDASPTAVHDVIDSSGACPVCVAVAGVSFGVAVASTLAGDELHVSGPVRLAILAAIDATEAELRAVGN